MSRTSKEQGFEATETILIDGLILCNSLKGKLKGNRMLSIIIIIKCTQKKTKRAVSLHKPGFFSQQNTIELGNKKTKGEIIKGKRQLL